MEPTTRENQSSFIGFYIIFEVIVLFAFLAFATREMGDAGHGALNALAATVTLGLLVIIRILLPLLVLLIHYIAKRKEQASLIQQTKKVLILNAWILGGLFLVVTILFSRP